MIAVTSVSPTHKNGDIQLKALESWKAHGFEVYCFQSPSEVDFLAPHYPKWVNWVKTHRTAEKTFKAPYVHINAFIDWAKEKDLESFMIINSDIIMIGGEKKIKELWANSYRGLIVMNREDFDEDTNVSTRYEWGMDAFIFHKSFYDIYPQGVYAMGQTWWDFWVPYRTLKANIPIYQVQEKIIYHKKHAIQYNAAEWMRMVQYFQWENNYMYGNNRRPQIINDRVLSEIQTGFRKTKGMI